MEELSDIDFEKIKTDYNNRNLKIGVELSLARKLLIECKDIITTLWSCSFIIIIIASFFVYFYVFGLLGFFGAILFSTMFSIYLGICSMPNKIKTVLFYVFIVCFLTSLLLIG